MFRQKTSSSPLRAFVTSSPGRGGEGGRFGMLRLGPAWTLHVPPGSERCQDLPPPSAPLPLQCRVGRHLPDPQEQWAGEGAGAAPSAAEDRGTATDPRTGRTLLGAVVLTPDSVSPALGGSPQSRALLRWMHFLLCLGHFDFIRAKRLA